MTAIMEKNNEEHGTAGRIFFRFLFTLDYFYNTIRNNRFWVVILTNICALLLAVGYQRYDSSPDSNTEESICEPCVDCPMTEITKMAIDNLATLTEWDKTINDNLTFIRKQVVNRKMKENITFLTGSTAEGCAIARWFHPDEEKHEIESDLQHIGGILTKDDKSFVEPLLDKPDNLKIRLDMKMLKRILHEKVWNELTDSDKDFHLFIENTIYFNPKVVRKIGEKLYRFIDDKFEDVKAIAAALFQIELDKFDVNMQTTKKETGTALTTTIVVKHTETGIIVRLSLDNVPALKCEFWPDSASDFNTRTSRKHPLEHPKWPSYDVRTSIMESGCDVVPKVSYKGDVNTEWRWSFSRAEKVLMNSLSDNQRRTYFLAKIIFYRHVKPIQNEDIHSYWVKTNMFWLCEDYPRDHEIWCDENLLDSVVLFYKQFLEMITPLKENSWYLPHFFIPRHSLLVKKPGYEVLQNQLAARVKEIIENIEQYTPSQEDFDDVYKRLQGPKSIVDGLASLSQGRPDTFKEKLEEIKQVLLKENLMKREQDYQG